MTLSPEQLDQYGRGGFLILDPEIPEQTLDDAVAQMDTLYEQRMHAATGGGRPNRVQDAWEVAPAVKAIATAPKVLDVLRELYLAQPLPFQTLNFPKGTEQKCHSDTIHFNSDPAGFMAGVWVALEDIGPDQGPLVYYPGSHELPEFTMQDFGLRPTDQEYGLYENAIHEVIEDLLRAGKLERKYATLRKGQALIWASNLIHGGSFQKDKELTRHSQVTHYFFEGTRYYTPMFSTPEEKFWRNPRWIQ